MIASSLRIQRMSPSLEWQTDVERLEAALAESGIPGPRAAVAGVKLHQADEAAGTDGGDR